MMVVEELLLASRGQLHTQVPEVDPLQDADALQEGQLVDLRVNAVGSMAALLFDLRTSLQFDVGNSSVLIVRGLRELRWREARTPSPLTAFSVVASRTSMANDARIIEVEFGFFPEASLTLQGTVAEFYVIEIPHIGAVPPDYSEASLERIKDSLPRWTAECSVVQGSGLRLSLLYAPNTPMDGRVTGQRRGGTSWTATMLLHIKLRQDGSCHPPFAAEEVEATEVGDHLFRLETLPSFASGLGAGDVVRAAHYGAKLWIEELVEPSGHSTVRVIALGSNSVDAPEKALQGFGCSTFKSRKDGMIVVDVPPSVDSLQSRYLVG